MSTNCAAYDGMKYYLAFKKERSNKWKVQPQAFLLHYTSSLTGQFVTTMWYNQLIIDSEPMHYAILEVKKDATMMEKRMTLIASIKGTHQTLYSRARLLAINSKKRTKL